MTFMEKRKSLCLYRDSNPGPTNPSPWLFWVTCGIVETVHRRGLRWAGHAAVLNVRNGTSRSAGFQSFPVLASSLVQTAFFSAVNPSCSLFFSVHLLEVHELRLQRLSSISFKSCFTNLTLCVPCIILQCVNVTVCVQCIILQCVNVTVCVPCIILQCVNVTVCVPCIILQCVNVTLCVPCIVLQCVNVTLCVPCIILQCVNVTLYVPYIILQCVNDQRDAQFL